jgi:hypothetical protein
LKHWSSYLQKHSGKYIDTKLPNQAKADVIVVIPCYNEPELIYTLQSIKTCSKPNANLLVVVIINSGIDAKHDVILQNRSTYTEVERFAVLNNESRLTYFPLLSENLPKKHSGVGLARKIGMDLAIDHFYTNNNKGIIISLDADCEISENFFVSIYDEYSQNDKLNSTIHNFYHRVEDDDYGIENAIRQYEMYLRYFSKMLKYTGFPYYYHTIGSAFAVSADAYVRVGGMGRQQGGEDFYFLQKIFQLGYTKELYKTFVYPKARFSDRVPFGTGPALQKILDEPDRRIKVYSKLSFYHLKSLFDMKDSFFKMNEKEAISYLSDLHPALQNFLKEINFLDSLSDCNNNCSSLNSFGKRFFHHFNSFKIIKYLNFVHPSPFPYEKIESDSIKI